MNLLAVNTNQILLHFHTSVFKHQEVYYLWSTVVCLYFLSDDFSVCYDLKPWSWRNTPLLSLRPTEKWLYAPSCMRDIDFITMENMLRYVSPLISPPVDQKVVKTSICLLSPCSPLIMNYPLPMVFDAVMINHCDLAWIWQWAQNICTLNMTVCFKLASFVTTNHGCRRCFYATHGT